MSRSRSFGARRTLVTIATLALGALTTPVTGLAMAPAAQAADCTPSAAGPCLPGSGTGSDPYRIGTWQDLDAARAAINADTTHTATATAHYVLTADVDYGQDTDTTGTWGGIDYFTGVFDGAGHQVSNLTYATDGAALNPTAMGFFRVVNQAVVKNLTLSHVTASGVYVIGGLTAYAYASTITGNSVIDATLSSTVPNGGLGIAGLVGMAYGTTQPTSTAVGETISNNRVVSSTLTDSDNVAGLVEYAVGGVTIENNYVSATLKNNITTGPAHSKAAGEVLGYVGGGTATTVRNNVVGGGSITYAGTSTTTSRTGFAGYVIGDTQNAAYTESNDLVANTLSITATSGTITGGPAAPAGKGNSDGIVVGPATLAQQATYAGTASGQTDGTATYKQLGWTVGATVDGTSVVSAWRWDATANAPVVADAPDVSFARHLYFQPSQTAPDALAAARAEATIDHGTLTAIDTGGVDWATEGTYDATVTAADQGFTTLTEVKIEVTSASRLTVAHDDLSFATNHVITDADIIDAAAPSMDDGAGHGVEGTFAVTDSTVVSGTAGDYTAAITGTDVHGFTTDPVTVQVHVIPAAITLGTTALYYEPMSTAPTAQQLLDALHATVTGGSATNLAIDPASLAAVFFDQIGDYTVTVTDTADGLPSVTAAIHVVPVPVITTSTTTMTVPSGGSLTANDVLDQTGAQLTDGAGHPVAGEVTVHGLGQVDTSTPGSYAVTLEGVETAGGFQADPVGVTVKVTQSTAPVVTLKATTAFVSAHDGPPTDGDVLAALGATIDHGTLAVDRGSADLGTPGLYSISVVGSDSGVPSTSVPATVVVTALAGTGTAADPLQIGSRADLDTAVARLNADTTGYRSARYVLTRDLDYGGDQFPGIDYFSGVWDGAGHTISNLTYVADNAALNPTAMGFFRVVNQAVVKNLTLSHVTASGSYVIGGLAAYAYASTITGNSVIGASLTSTVPNGGLGIGGLVGMAYGTTQPTSTAVGETISNNRVVDATLTDSDNLGGLVEYASNGVIIEKNYVSATLRNNVTTGPARSKAVGGILGYVGGGTTNTVRNNVVGGGSIVYAGTSTSTSRTGYAGYVIGDVTGTAWTESNDLVANTVTITATSGTITGGASTPSGKGSTDGIVVSPATLAQQATYTGTASGQTDGAATYKQLGWAVGATVDGTSVVSAWRWDATTNAPVVADAPTVTFSGDLHFQRSATAPSPAEALAAAQAQTTVDHGAVTALHAGDVDWNTVGTYDATVTAEDQGFTTVSPARVDVVPASRLAVAHTTIYLPVGQSVTDAAILAAAAPSMNDGAGHTVEGSFAVTASTVESGTVGHYTATLAGTDEYGFTTDPITIGVDIVSAAILLDTSTLFYKVGTTPPTAAQLLDALGATVGGGSDANLAIDPATLAALDFDTVGDYAITITDVVDEAPPVSATIRVVPVPVVTTTTTTVSVPVGTALTSSGVLSMTGAQLTDGHGSPVNGSLAVTGIANVDTSRAGSYPITISGTETAGGFAADPVTITVKVVWTTAPVVALGVKTIFVTVQTGQPSDEELLDALGATIDHGTLDVDLGDSNFQSPGAYSITVTGSDEGVPSTSVPATLVVTLLKGAGTAADPLQIGSRSDLDVAVEQLNDDTAGYRTAHYVVTANINYDGDRLVGIDYFSGVWDGAGHTISNITYATDNATIKGTAMGLFRVLDQGTVKNLSINNAVAKGVENTGGLVAYAYASTVTGCSVLNSDISSTYGGGGGGVGGLVGQAWESSLANSSAAKGTTVSNNQVLNTTVTGNDNVAGLVEYAVGKVVISNNYVAAKLVNTSTGGPTTSKGAGELLGYVGGGGSTSVSVKNNAVGAGSIAYGGAPSSGQSRTGFAGYVIGDTHNSAYVESNDLVTNTITITTASGTITGGASTPGGKGSTDGIVVGPATLATRTTYSGTATGQTDTAVTPTATYTQLGWDFGAGNTPGVWEWDSSAARPRLAGVPELLLPTVTIDKDTALYVAGAVPDDAQILADLGASMSPQGTLSLDWQGAERDVPGTYRVKVEGVLDGNAGFPPIATVTVVPWAVVSTAVTSIEYLAGSAVSEAQLLADVGASLSATGSLSADLSTVDFATPGTYPVTIDGTDQYLIEAVPATVDVVIVDPGGIIVVGDLPPAELTGTPQVGRPLSVDPASVSTIGDPTYRWLRTGEPIAGATAATYVPAPDDAGQLLQVVVTSGSDSSVTTTSAPVTVAAGAFEAGRPTATGPARVGTALSADAGAWTPTPTALAYQWKRDGVPIAGATGASYQLTPAELGTQVSVEVDAVRAGYTPSRAESAAVAVGAGSFTDPHRPTVKGRPEVGRRLRAVVVTGSPTPSLAFQWFAGSKPIRGATGATYQLRAAQRHHRLRVVVTETLPGYQTISLSSAATKAVR